MNPSPRGLAPLIQKHFQGREEELYGFFLPFYQAMAIDVLIGFFFVGKDLPKIAANQAQLIMKATGLSPSYGGKLPGAAHLQIAPILTGHFNRRLRILEDHLARKGLKPEEIAQWIQFENSFRAAIESR